MFETGYYMGRFKEAVLTSQGDKKTPALAMKFDIVSFKNNGTLEMLAGDQERTVFLWLSDEAWQYSEEKLKRLGFNGDFDSPKFTKTDDDVELQCDHEEYDGKTREKWNLAFAGSMVVEKSTPDVVRLMNARWRQSVGTTPPPANTAPAAPSPPPPAPTEPAAPAAVATEPKFTTKEAAWGEFVRVFPGEDNEKRRIGEWRSATMKVAGIAGKTEDQFGPKEWDDVAAEAIPF